MKPLSNVAAERAVLAAICQYGNNVYLDVADMLQESTFTVEFNKFIYAAIKQCLKGNNLDKLDFVSVLAAGCELGLEGSFETTPCQNHLNSLFNCAVSEKNARKLAAQIRKLEIARLLKNKLHQTADKLQGINGEETVSHILGMAETAIFDFSRLLHDNDNEPKYIYDGLSEYIEYLANNPIDQIGLPSGMPEWDKAIGGGMRPGAISIIAARMKVGKSIISSNIGYHVASVLKVPVLNLDTEMTYEDHLNRMLAMASECFIFDIETGKFTQKPGTDTKVRETAKYIEKHKIPYAHKSIAGMPFEDQLAIARRWLVKDVGLTSTGTAKPCLIILDYLKLMSGDGISNNMAEYQAIGFIMSSLHNFAVRYKVPILCMLQLNRDGINKESTDAISQSDRIAWLCSNLSILKLKSNEEIAQDGPEHGNRKLVPVVSRHGPCLDEGDYINMYFRGAIAKIVEGKRKFQLPKPEQNEGVDE